MAKAKVVYKTGGMNNPNKKATVTPSMKKGGAKKSGKK